VWIEKHHRNKPNKKGNAFIFIDAADAADAAFD